MNFIRASSGHWYFNLNDGRSQIKCVCWKGTNYRIRFTPENGITVRIRGRISFYEARGETQIVVESLEPSGEGALRAAFEQIRAKLEEEGLFEPELKRKIPFFPRRVGVVTTSSGAAIHDILNVLTRRARSIGIVLAPTMVQGEGAADSIRKAVSEINQYNLGLSVGDRIDVLIVGRGGGSAEDLWAFNDEHLARALRASEIPVISAVGHEIDWTISDMIADVRAATPSAAAEMVAAREEDIFNTLASAEERVAEILDRIIYDSTTRVEDAVLGLEHKFASSVRRARESYFDISSRLTPATLRAKAVAVRNRLDMLGEQTASFINRTFKAKSELLNLEMAKLNVLSPLAVLTRGYSITQGADGRIIRDASSAKPGDKLKIRVERGKLNAEVLSSEE